MTDKFAEFVRRLPKIDLTHHPIFTDRLPNIDDLLASDDLIPVTYHLVKSTDNRYFLASDPYEPNNTFYVLPDDTNTIELILQFLTTDQYFHRDDFYSHPHDIDNFVQPDNLSYDDSILVIETFLTYEITDLQSRS